ncbi:hypothetical protein VN21_14650 [Paraclostridium benzoelyticum]|uniref:Uncharacterized protein n=1 Tax=Paraclostridium benzoelyticum TaxID=1629550 RepID=A0A0M3DDW6_9FIRM|nr:hypothetical protein VN21_14650 [Paraclostridium benzoelyticum]
MKENVNLDKYESKKSGLFKSTFLLTCHKNEVTFIMGGILIKLHQLDIKNFIIGSSYLFRMRLISSITLVRRW